jgi:hypothetical protein
MDPRFGRAGLQGAGRCAEYAARSRSGIRWDDGVEKNLYVVTNENSRTRFRFVGDAKITADWSAGYLLEIGAHIANSETVNQLVDEDNIPGLDANGQAVEGVRIFYALSGRHCPLWSADRHLRDCV